MLDIISLFVPLLDASIADTIEEALKADGKYYAVVAVIAILFLGFFSYLINLESKIGQIEENRKRKQQ